MVASPLIPWLELHAVGLYCVPGQFYIDPCAAVARAVVSHAHADHYPRFCGEVHATAETLALGRVRYEATAAKQPFAHPYGESFHIGPVAVTLLPAGHMLGSAQVLIAYNGQHVLYSGDIGFDQNPTCAPIQLPEVQVDLLICESTFGEKASHATPEEAVADLLARAGKRHLIIATYALGKAQRINRLLQDLAPGIEVFVDRTIIPFHNTYRNLGTEPGQHKLYRRQDVKWHRGQYAWLLPPKKMTGFHRDREFYKVFASGWDKSLDKAWVNGQFEVSDHASQAELQAYVAQLRPREVLFWHGYPEPLIAHCRSLGIAAGKLGLEATV